MILDFFAYVRAFCSRIFGLLIAFGAFLGLSACKVASQVNIESKHRTPEPHVKCPSATLEYTLAASKLNNKQINWHCSSEGTVNSWGCGASWSAQTNLPIADIKKLRKFHLVLKNERTIQNSPSSLLQVASECILTSSKSSVNCYGSILGSRIFKTKDDCLKYCPSGSPYINTPSAQWYSTL